MTRQGVNITGTGGQFDRNIHLVGGTRRQHRAESRYPAPAGPEICHGARRVRRSFCHPGTKLVELTRVAVQSLIGAANLSPVTNLVAGTGAVSRYKANRSQKTVKVYWNLIASRCACPGATAITKLSWVQEQKQKL